MSLSLQVYTKILQHATLVVVLSNSEIPKENYNANLRIMDVESQQDLGHLLENIIRVNLSIITAHPLPSLHLTRVDFSTSKGYITVTIIANYSLPSLLLTLVNIQETRSLVKLSRLSIVKRHYLFLFLSLLHIWSLKMIGMMDIMWPASQSHVHLLFIFIEINFYSLSFLLKSLISLLSPIGLKPIFLSPLSLSLSLSLSRVPLFTWYQSDPREERAALRCPALRRLTLRHRPAATPCDAALRSRPATRRSVLRRPAWYRLTLRRRPAATPCDAALLPYLRRGDLPAPVIRLPRDASPSASDPSSGSHSAGDSSST